MNGRSLSAWRIAARALLEPLVRMAGFIARGVDRDQAGVEMRLRGWILGGQAAWRIGRNVQFVGEYGRFLFGPGVCLLGNTYLNAYGRAGRIEIGAHTHIDQNSVLYGQGGLRVGADCAIAAGTIIYTQTNADHLRDGTPVAHQPVAYGPVAIGDGCWLGAGARVLPGVSIGAAARVGAGAVVTEDLPSNVTAVGIPARILATSPSKGR